MDVGFTRVTMLVVGVLFVGASFVPQARQLAGAALGGMAREIGGYAVKFDESEKDRCAEASAHWKSAEAIGTPEALLDHIDRFGSCAFAGLARAKLKVATGTEGSLPSTGSVAGDPTASNVGVARGEAAFRADCDAHQGTVYTAAEWNRMSPGANLQDGQLHCHRAASWTVDKVN
jgi:hypothetical protein